MSRERIVRVTVVLTVLQAVVFYEHEAAALTFLFALGLGIWLRRWTAALWMVASFAVAFLLAAVTGWMEDPRVADAILGAALAFLGGLIGGGIFQLLHRETAVEAAPSASRAA